MYYKEGNKEIYVWEVYTKTLNLKSIKKFIIVQLKIYTTLTFYYKNIKIKLYKYLSQSKKKLLEV